MTENEENQEFETARIRRQRINPARHEAAQARDPPRRLAQRGDGADPTAYPFQPLGEGISMTGKIIQFSAIASKPRTPIAGPAGMPPTVSAQPIPSPELTFVRRGRPLPEPQTETCRNQRLRKARKDAWHRARRTTDYFEGLLKWRDVLSCAQRAGVPHAVAQPEFDSDERLTLVAAWRAAVVKQLLTPAPDLLAVSWKKAQLAGRGFDYLPTKAERIERAIADDVAFLEAHPTRRR